jgi:hypothetical protein
MILDKVVRLSKDGRTETRDLKYVIIKEPEHLLFVMHISERKKEYGDFSVLPSRPVRSYQTLELDISVRIDRSVIDGD